MLTGLLVNHFIAGGKPLLLLDGNQKGVGKTLLAEVVSAVLDGKIPHLIPFTANEEELSKVICATLRGSQQSTLVIDNARVPAGKSVSSPTLESLSSEPIVNLRVLKTSEMFVCPNDKLWMITMNDTRTNADLISRGLPIRFFYEGDPRKRQFSHGDPLQYALDHRQQILTELAGMVMLWLRQNKPRGQIGHRFRYWAEVVGGILTANELPEGLTNLDEAAAEFDTAADGLAALAEVAVARGQGFVSCEQDGALSGSESAQRAPVGHVAADWKPLFHTANLLQERLEAANSTKSKQTLIGNFLSPHVGRSVPIEVRGRQGKATLRSRVGRSKRKEYHFDIEWDEAAPGGNEPAAQLRERKVAAAALNQTGHPHKSAPQPRVMDMVTCGSHQQPGVDSGGQENAEAW